MRRPSGAVRTPLQQKSLPGAETTEKASCLANDAQINWLIDNVLRHHSPVVPLLCDV